MKWTSETLCYGSARQFFGRLPHIDGSVWTAFISAPRARGRHITVERSPSASDPGWVDHYAVEFYVAAEATDDECQQLVSRIVAGERFSA